ncbi:hypothetical protein L2E82_28830 [Cichorium intybus]|uniref:Uncharacterized protein n=1 Tax=Cichorium intybus TaxID=13427 RepID=A0ACB9CWM4_CICIN|nr:hypothetical protein L2E82_28830 [Cichorium intybus]
MMINSLSPTHQPSINNYDTIDATELLRNQRSGTISPSTIFLQAARFYCFLVMIVRSTIAMVEKEGMVLKNKKPYRSEIFCLRIQMNKENKGFKDLPPEDAFANSVLCNLVLHLEIMNFLG